MVTTKKAPGLVIASALRWTEQNGSAYVDGEITMTMTTRAGATVRRTYFVTLLAVEVWNVLDAALSEMTDAAAAPAPRTEVNNRAAKALRAAR